MLIRAEAPKGRTAVYAVNPSAFATPAEARLFDGEEARRVVSLNESKGPGSNWFRAAARFIIVLGLSSESPQGRPGRNKTAPDLRGGSWRLRNTPVRR
jgi:hypothetical protein